MRTEGGHTHGGRVGEPGAPARHRPAVGVALALMAGILAAWRLDPSAAGLLGAGALAAAGAAVLAIRRPASRRATLAVLAVVAVLGAARYWLATTPLDPAHLGRFATSQRVLVRVAGRIVTEPYLRDPERSREVFQPVLGPSTRFYLRAESLTHANVQRRVSGLALVMVHDRVTGLHAGDPVEVVGRLTSPSGPTNPGQRIRPGAPLAAILTTDHGEAITSLSPRRAASGSGWLALLRRHMAVTITRHLDQRSAGVLLALLTGERGRVEGDLRREFVVTGTAHLLAISGLHVGLLAAMAWWVLRAVRVPERPALVLVVIVAFLYATLTGLHAPALRACVMIAILALGGLLQRDPDHVNSLAVAAVVVLLLDPTDLFQAGFQLSFVATLGLLLFVRPVSGALCEIRRRLLARTDAWERVEAVARPGRRWSLLRRVVRVLRDGASVSLVAWIVTAPLSAHWFRHIAWLCPMATLAAVPFLWCSVASGLVMCLAGAFGLAHLVAPVVGASLHLLEGVLTWFADIPGSAALEGWYAPLGVMLLCYLGYGVIALRQRLGLSRKRIGLALAVVAAGVVWCALADRAPSAPELTALDVGHGQCSILRTPEGRTVLFDAGSLTRAGGAWRTVERALVTFGVRRIDLVVLSHPDIDHYSALPGLLAAFPVDEIVVAPRFMTSQDPEVGRLIECIHEARVPVRVAKAGDAIDRLGPLRLTVLHPGPDSAALSDNNASLVVRAVYNRVRLLATGDLQEAGIALLLSSGAPVESEVLLAPHHGRYEPNLDALMRAVEPRVVLISGPLTPRVRRALPVYQRLATGRGERVFVTGECGAMTVRLAPEPPVRTWGSPGRTDR